MPSSSLVELEVKVEVEAEVGVEVGVMQLRINRKGKILLFRSGGVGGWRK